MNALEQQNQEKIDAIIESVRGVTNCARCGRTLTDPVSVKRGMGPICWAESGGGAFAADLKASDEEWWRREKHLRSGGGIDFGHNWLYPNEKLGIGETMRVSVRYRGFGYQSYGSIARQAPDWQGCVDEVVFYSGPDLQAAYEAAVQAGPRCTAMTYRMKKMALRKARRAARGGAPHVRS